MLRRAGVLVVVLMATLCLVGCGQDSDAMYEAVNSGDLARVKEMVKAHPSLANARHGDVGPDAEMTMLQWAINSQHHQVAAFLISKGADVNAPCRSGYAPLHFAAERGDTEAISMLLSAKADPSVADDRGVTPVYLAAGLGNTRAARLLATRGATGVSAIGIASAIGDLSGVANELAKDARSVNHREKRGETPLILAAANGQVGVARRLLRAGAGIDLKDEDGFAALHVAATGGHLDVCRLLIAAQSDLDVTNEYGETPLYYAVQNTQIDAARLLLDSGADPNVMGRFGTPLHRAAGGDVRDDDVAARITELLISHGTNANSQTGDGWTPLHFAAVWNKPKTASCLIKHGADPAVKTKEGETPLALARREGHSAVVRAMSHGSAARLRGDQTRPRCSGPNARSTLPIGQTD